MTTSDYIKARLKGIDIDDSIFLGVGLYPDEDVEFDNMDFGVRFCMLIEEILFMPRIKTINESGFSISWDYGDLAKYYLLLCRRYGVKPNDDALEMAGISAIYDKTDTW